MKYLVPIFLGLAQLGCNNPPIQCAGSEHVYCDEQASRCYCTQDRDAGAHFFSTLSQSTLHAVRIQTSDSTLRYTKGASTTNVTLSGAAAYIAGTNQRIMGLQLALQTNAGTMLFLARMPSPEGPTLQFTPLENDAALHADWTDLRVPVASTSRTGNNFLQNFSGTARMRSFQFTPTSALLEASIDIDFAGIHQTEGMVRLAGSLQFSGTVDPNAQ